MRSVIVLAVLMVATGMAFYVVWMNRASEKIVTAVIPIAIAALIGVNLAVFVFGGQPPVTIKFPVVLLYRSSDLQPWVPSNRPLLRSLFEVPELKNSHPEQIADSTSGATLYHHLLQKAIVDTLVQHHRSSWDTDITRFDIGFMEEMSVPSSGAEKSHTRLSQENVRELLKSNRFQDCRFGQGPLTLPPATKVRIRAPEISPTVGEQGEIVFDNPFVTLTIKTRFSSYMAGLGSYGVMQDRANVSDFRAAEYLVTINAEYNRLRSGHPKMVKYQRWVQQIASELQTEMDEQVIWAKTKSDYLFRKQLQQFGVDTGPDRPNTLNAPEFH